MTQLVDNSKSYIQDDDDDLSDGQILNPDLQPLKVPTQGSILLQLFIHSVAMFSLPFGAYYFTKQYVESEYDISSPRSFIYGAIAAVVLVHVVIVSYVYQAFKEEAKFKAVKEQSRKDQ